jgi:hypothetical protein
MIQVIGYAEINGVRTFPDAVITAFYQQMVKEGTLEIVFSDGSIESAEQFLQFAKRPENILALAVVDNQIMCMAWLNGCFKNHAFTHYAMLKAAWGKHTDAIAKAYFDYWFSFESEGKPLIDILLGQTPEWNRKGIKFLQRIGWTVLGTIPRIANGYGMTISYFTRDDYGKIKQQTR